MSLSQGSTFLNNNIANLDTHLWVVLSDPYLDENQVIIVNVTTWRDRATFMNDASCILQASEHPFIAHKSYVYYKKATITSVENLQKAFAARLLVEQDSCSAEFLEKVLSGVSSSEHTPIRVLGVLRDQGLID